MTNVLITGATGSLGRALLSALSKDAFTVVASATKNTLDNEVRFVPCDLLDHHQISRLIETTKPDIIFHLAATFGQDLNLAYQLNVAATVELLESIKKLKLATRLLMIGSAAEYGLIKPEDNPISEQTPLVPFTVYGVTKAWQSQLLGLYANQGIDVLCARIFNLFGPHMSNRLFAGYLDEQITLLKAGKIKTIQVGQLTAIRDYLSTADAAKQLIKIAEKGLRGNVYHVGSGTPMTMEDFLKMQLKKNGLDENVITLSDELSSRGIGVQTIYADMRKTRSLELN